MVSKSSFAFNNSGYISNLNIRKKVQDKIEEVATKLEVYAVILDALRYPSPHDGATMFSCFCTYCKKTMKELDVNPEKLQLNLRRLAKTLYKYPHLDPETLEALHT